MSSSTSSRQQLKWRSLRGGLQGALTKSPARVTWRLYIAALIIVDALAMGAAFRIAYWLRFEVGLPLFRLEIEPSFYFYRRLTMVLIPVLVLVLAGSGLYSRKNLLGGIGEYSLAFQGTTLGLFLVIIAGFLEPTLVIARGYLLLAWVLCIGLIMTGRFLARRVIYRLRRRGLFVNRALIVGLNEEARLLAEQLLSWETSGLRIMGAIGSDAAGSQSAPGDIPRLGSVDEIERIVSENQVEEIILATSALSKDQIIRIFQRYGMSDEVQLRMSSGLFEIISTGLYVKELAYVPLVSVNKVRLTGWDRAIKLATDYGLTIPGLILISPLLLLVAILVKLDSKGPVFHRRRVMGLNGTQFDALKFRTMAVNGDDLLAQHPGLASELERNHKLKNDPRITRIGRTLRRFSLDELPQLFNVLARDMSLVGPRMISPEEMAKYDQWGINLLTVRPGITGLWQVSGRSDIDYRERVRLDMHYIRNWTIWLDLKLLLQTVPAVISGRGAY
jgi:exopolysaccharide biosynthesis polyprenyl glycosylphosphotransferase